MTMAIYSTNLCFTSLPCAMSWQLNSLLPPCSASHLTPRWVSPAAHLGTADMDIALPSPSHAAPIASAMPTWCKVPTHNTPLAYSWKPACLQLCTKPECDWSESHAKHSCLSPRVTIAASLPSQCVRVALPHRPKCCLPRMLLPLAVPQKVLDVCCFLSPPYRLFAAATVVAILAHAHPCWPHPSGAPWV